MESAQSSVARRSWVGILAIPVLLVLGGGWARAQPVEPPVDLPPAAQETAPPPASPVAEAAPAWLSPLGRGTGPGLPWQVVLALQWLSYAALDALPFATCVGCSWVASLLVPLGPGLPLALLLTLVLIPPSALVSGCASGLVLQFIGDRLGVLRGRLACVGLTSTGLSFLTYALVIAPIILGMGFFAVASVTFLSASAIPWLPHGLPGPAALYSLVGYSVSAAGAGVAVAVLLAGALAAPLVGFVCRPAAVALMYRASGRTRRAGEEQWPPSLVGERADQLPWPWRKKSPATMAAPAPLSPVSPAPEDAAPLPDWEDLEDPTSTPGAGSALP